MAQTPNTPSPSAKLAAARVISGGVLLILSGVTVLWGDHAPFLAPLTTGLAVLIGKFLAVPTSEVTQLALAMLARKEPERAMEVVTKALESLPPAAADTAASRILASLHPPANDNGTTIQFVGESQAPGGPLAPDGTPVKLHRP